MSYILTIFHTYLYFLSYILYIIYSWLYLNSLCPLWIYLLGMLEGPDIVKFENLWDRYTRGTYGGLRTLRRSGSRTRFTRAPRYLVDLPMQLYRARTGGRWGERDWWQRGISLGGKGGVGGRGVMSIIGFNIDALGKPVYKYPYATVITT